jgi:hypothetical protein
MPEPERRSFWGALSARLQSVGVWAIGAIAAVALLLSNIDTIRTQLKSLFNPQQTYQASIVIHDIPLVSVVDQNRLSIDGAIAFTLHNSGTAPVVVRHMEMVVTQKRAAVKQDCTSTESDQFEADFEPLVLKPNDLIENKRKLKFVGRVRQTKAGDKILFPTQKELMVESGLIVQICFLVEVSTPQATSISTEIDYGDFDIDKRQAYMGHSRSVEHQAIMLVH